MTAGNRRAFVTRLMERDDAAGRAFEQDADFMILVELWIEGDVDMRQMRHRYRLIRKDRLDQKRADAKSLQPPADPSPEADARIAATADQAMSGLMP